MIKLSSTGSFDKTENFIKRVQNGSIYSVLRSYGDKGVSELSKATPKDSGETARSWKYEIEKRRGHYKITWLNTHEDAGVPIAIILQYGHATGTGGWVEGRDYINPAIKPVFDKMASEFWREVTRNG